MSLNTNTSGNRRVLPAIVRGPTAKIFAFENVEVRRTATSIPVKTGNSVPPDCRGRETTVFWGAGIMPTRASPLHWRTTEQIGWSPRRRKQPLRHSLCSLLFLQRNPDSDRRSTVRTRLDGKRTSDEVDSFPHADQPQALMCGCTLRVETGAVIANLKLNVVFSPT